MSFAWREHNVHLGFSTRDGMFQDACGCAAVAVVSAIRLPRSAEGRR